MHAVITLTTDFGHEDAYVGVMKGVIISVNPHARIIDICHHIEPQNVGQAAFVLGTAYPYFPTNAIHVAVVDPGVGTARRAIILKTEQGLFVGPDNGVLSYVLRRTSPQSHSGEASLVPVPSGWEVYAITNPRYWRHPVSASFHGRDIFAPVAAHLSLGVPCGSFGEAIEAIHAIALPAPRRTAGQVAGRILHIDHFGNVITNIREEDLPEGRWRIEVQGRRIESLSGSYEAIEEIGAMTGSSGYLEIAARGKSAAGVLGLRIGDEVIVAAYRTA
jgi:S-adenosyl-L-methionine hydrolase (adenosine-forming)